MIKKILAFFAALGGIFSAVFYVLMKQSKDEQKKAEAEAKNEKKKAEEAEALRKAENDVHKSIAKQEAKNEELVQRAGAGNNLDSFNAGLDLLRKQSERGNKRNTGSGSARA